MTEIALSHVAADPFAALLLVGAALTLLVVATHEQAWRAALVTGAGTGLLVLGALAPT